jgi:hypothetical protein
VCEFGIWVRCSCGVPSKGSLERFLDIFSSVSILTQTIRSLIKDQVVNMVREFAPGHVLL